MNSPNCCYAVLFACLLNIAPLLHAQAPVSSQSIRWISSTQSEPWKQMPLTAVSSAGQSLGTDPIQIDERKTYQQIDGFGGCFNDLGWEALKILDEPTREKALQALFSPDGANFTLGRVPMGANDFATGWYSFDETPGDFDLKNFSIDHDRKTILPFIHAAMKYQPKLAVWGVPWSPPSWMKTNGAYKGGEMKSDPRTLASYALYFSKYVQAYRKEGINLYAVMPQNEPKYNNNVYPQAVWSAALMDVFLRDYLAPRLKQDNVKVEIWQGTIVNEKLEDFILPVLDDPKTNPLITGIAYQYGGQDALLATHERYPDKKLMQSETECYNGENQWQQGLITFAKIIEDMNHYAGSYFFWNTVLNEEGKSTWGWRQNSLLTVNRGAKLLQFNPEFYSMKHFSASVMPGAQRIAVSGGPFKDIVAFRNSSGTKVIVFVNDREETIVTSIQHSGRVYPVQVPAKSMNTITIPAIE
jgi:glucosylceramidase